MAELHLMVKNKGAVSQDGSLAGEGKPAEQSRPIYVATVRGKVLTCSCCLKVDHGEDDCWKKQRERKPML